MFKATEEESSRSVLSTPFLVGVLCACGTCKSSVMMLYNPPLTKEYVERHDCGFGLTWVRISCSDSVMGLVGIICFYPSVREWVLCAISFSNQVFWGSSKRWTRANELSCGLSRVVLGLSSVVACCHLCCNYICMIITLNIKIFRIEIKYRSSFVCFS